jgi:phosphonoacetaldehyde hydrolase
VTPRAGSDLAPGRIGLVVLDWAGTIVDFGCFAPAVAFREVFRQAGVEVSMAQARGPMGLPKKEHLRAIARLPEVAARWREIHGRAPEEADVDRLYALFEPLQIAALERHGDPIPGAIEAIADLRLRGIRIGSTTGYTRAMMDVVMRSAAAAGLTVDAVVCSDEVPAGRPHPWMALRNMTELGIYPPCRAVKVGDTLPDIAEGRNAGMWAVAVIRASSDMGLGREELEALAPEQLHSRSRAIADRFLAAGAHRVIDSIGGLPAIIDDIDARLRGGERP